MTSVLDSDYEKSIMSSIDKIKNDKTIIMVTHKMDTIKKCNKVYLIQNKSIVLQN
jgi:ATP-binding cassette, subfamily B, bacterial PglK